MTRYFYAQTFGYGKIIKEYSSDYGHHEVKCSLGGFLWKSPMFFIEESESEQMSSGYLSYTMVKWVKCQEFFTGIDLDPPYHEDCGSQGLFIDDSDYKKEVSAVEFERLVGAISEKKRKKIAFLIRQYNEAALKLFNSRKVAAEQIQLAEETAAQRLKQIKHY